MSAFFMDFPKLIIYDSSFSIEIWRVACRLVIRSNSRVSDTFQIPLVNPIKKPPTCTDGGFSFIWMSNISYNLDFHCL